jgi:2-dehydropantoate 2-reductase
MDRNSNLKLNIWIYGAGAVGCYYGARLWQAGQNVLFIARGQQLKALQEKGLQVLSCKGDFVIYPIQSCSEEALTNQFKPDLVLVCTKSYSNIQVAEHLKEILKSEIPLFVFQNGLKSENIFKKYFASDKVLRSVINVAASLEAPGKLLHRADDFVILPNTDGLAVQLLQILESVGVMGKLSDDIQVDIWSKVAWNAAFNSVTALTRLTTKPVLEDKEGLNLIKQLLEEVHLLAKANNINLPFDLPEQKIQHTLKKLGDISTSTLEDVKNGKKIEYNALLGDLIEEAQRLKIEVPHLQTAFTLLKLLDKSF